jgi:hypothetical protein
VQAGRFWKVAPGEDGIGHGRGGEGRNKVLALEEETRDHVIVEWYVRGLLVRLDLELLGGDSVCGNTSKKERRMRMWKLGQEEDEEQRQERKTHEDGQELKWQSNKHRERTYQGLVNDYTFRSGLVPLLEGEKLKFGHPLHIISVLRRC